MIFSNFRLTLNEIKSVKNTFAQSYNVETFYSDQQSVAHVSQALNTPTFVLPVDSQGFMRVDNPVIIGRGTPQSKITVFADGNVVGIGRSDDLGYWAILTDTLSSGRHSFAVSQSTSDNTSSVMSGTINAEVRVSSSGLKFSITSLADNGASADKDFLQNLLDDTAARLSAFVDADMTIPLRVNVTDLGGAAAAAGSSWLGVESNGMPILAYAALDIGLQYPNLYTKTDFSSPSLIAHEMMHVLGFSSYVPTFREHIKVEADGAYFF